MSVVDGFLSVPARRERRGSVLREPDDVLSYADEDDTPWLLPYVDVASLLLAVVILILAMSKVSLHRFEMLSSTLSQEAPPPSLEVVKKRLDETLRAQRLADQVATRLDDDGLRMELKNALLFESGQADITTAGRGVIDHIIPLLPTLDRRYQIAIEGHTDDVPIHTARFASNWDLSSMRANNVLKAFLAAGIEPRRLSAQGYADTRPARPAPAGATSDVQLMAQVRSENRRVVVRIY